MIVAKEPFAIPRTRCTYHDKRRGPRDLFDDISLDNAGKVANELAEHLRSHGPFEPHRLPMDEMEYTTMPQVMRKLEGRFVSVKEKI